MLQRTDKGFNPCAPCGARHAYDGDPNEPVVFQSTRPMRGATGVRLRALRGVWVSIHAPHAGRDMVYIPKFTVPTGFNPRAPCGARQRSCVYSSAPESFQSTRPMRGATGDCSRHKRSLNVSIHAPHAGRDRTPQSSMCFHRCFNPRAPCGARPMSCTAIPTSQSCQSTRPKRGATTPISEEGHTMLVSIHAPHAGRDYCAHHRP